MMVVAVKEFFDAGIIHVRNCSACHAANHPETTLFPPGHDSTVFWAVCPLTSERLSFQFTEANL